ncbi:TetR family transcriptional regulator [Alkalimarinus coralli]|uniref:TetR family transcriptional regulator n=1 Tax=Alkalimarinus coralli TaxID=2935863 RepID=UPI00202B8496|nr:TetR family transcriptional regulator [Alkalimarinus coralli]
MARNTKENAAKTRQKILISALDVILENGFAKTSLEQIAQSAEVTRGAIYWHFANKPDLFSALLQEWIQPSNELAVTLLIDQEPSLENLKQFMVAWLSHMESNPVSHKLFDIIFFKVEQVGDIKALIDQIHTNANQDRQALQLYLNELFSKGELTKQVDLSLLAISISAFLMGHAQNWLARPDEYSLKQHAKALVNQFFAGYLPVK